ncbi:hypothetical protein [Weissella minor]|nr:hypothetical protein [Weissella minor]
MITIVTYARAAPSGMVKSFPLNLAGLNFCLKNDMGKSTLI